MTSPFPQQASTPFAIPSMSPRYATPAVAPSPAPSTTSSLPVNAERDLCNAISKLGPLLAGLKKEYEDFWSSLESFDGNAPERLKSLLARFASVENLLRSSGLGALPINGEMDLSVLGVTRAKEAQELFVARQKAEESAAIVAGILRAA